MSTVIDMTTIKISRANIPDGATPILTHCRAMIADGHDPSTRLEVFRDHAEPDIIVGNIGIAAGLGISEGDHAPRFIRYRPPSPEVRQTARGFGAGAFSVAVGSSAA